MKRLIVVTGGNGALGTAVVGRLLEEGFGVAIPAFHAAEHPAVAGFAHRDRAEITPGIDLTDEDQVAGYYAGLDGLWASVHLAGGFAMGPVTETSAADFDRMWNMNARSCFLCCREAARSMSSGGRIVNVAARPGLSGAANLSAYAASKAAVASLTQSLAEELAPAGIWVNAVVPSVIDTPGNRAAMPDADFDAWVRPEAIAASIAFLVSDEAAGLRGALLPTYGNS